MYIPPRSGLVGGWEYLQQIPLSHLPLLPRQGLVIHYQLLLYRYIYNVHVLARRVRTCDVGERERVAWLLQVYRDCMYTETHRRNYGCELSA